MKESASFVLYHTKKHERNSVCLSLCGPVSRNSCKTENEGHLLVTATQSFVFASTPKLKPEMKSLLQELQFGVKNALQNLKTNKTTDWRSRLHMYNNQPVGCMYVYHSQPASCSCQFPPTTVEAPKTKSEMGRDANYGRLLQTLSHPQYWFDDCEKPAKNSTATKH
jgi:hypothetical protein